MFEIRWHGRGGQGVVTAAKIFALTASAQNGYFQAFPEFGPERRGAPLQAFTRVDDKPIRIYNQVYFPDMVVVLDSKLIGRQPLTVGLKDGGYFIANFHGTSDELKEAAGVENATVLALDASDIAYRIIGRPIPNTPMLGAAAILSKFIQLEVLVGQLEEFFKDKLDPADIETNIIAVREGAEQANGR
jgi:pyruvate ferredoxin oxidoreductase gamma subunit